MQRFPKPLNLKQIRGETLGGHLHFQILIVCTDRMGKREKENIHSENRFGYRSCPTVGHRILNPGKLENDLQTFGGLHSIINLCLV